MNNVYFTLEACPRCALDPLFFVMKPLLFTFGLLPDVCGRLYVENISNFPIHIKIIIQTNVRSNWTDK
jgi:hypothetical protein